MPEISAGSYKEYLVASPQDFSEHLRFEPYIGNAYDAGYGLGVKLLVLGESHYGTDRGADMTRYWLGLHIDGTERAPFWTKLERAISGCTRENVDPRAFWSRAAFANIIQEVLADRGLKLGPREWATVEPAFCEFLDRLSPDLVLLFAKGAWDKLPQEPAIVPSLVSPNNECAAIYPRRDGGRTLTGSFSHPSPFGWKAEDWHLYIRRLLASAATLKKTGHVPGECPATSSS